MKLGVLLVVAATTALGAHVFHKGTRSDIPSIKPVRGEFVRRFGLDSITGKTEMHDGLDIKGRPRAAVVSTADGRIKSILSRGKLKMVTVDHNDNTETIYENLAEVKVERGQKVKVGQNLGRLGDQDRTLHYEVRINGQPIDPMNYIKN